MAIDIKTDESGTSIDIEGKVGDVFGEALFTVAHTADNFKTMNQDIYDTFSLYLKTMLDAIDEEEMSNGEPFDIETFCSQILELIRVDPKEAIDRYEAYAEEFNVENRPALVLMAMPTDYIRTENE